MKQKTVIFASFFFLVLGASSVGFGQGSWSVASSIGFNPKANLTCNIIDNKIYVVGGESLYVALNTLDVFDPVTNSWNTPKTSGTFEPHSKHVSCVVGNKIYVIGGANNLQSDDWYVQTPVQVFDPALNRWDTPKTSGVFTPRDGCTATVAGGKIYVIGGDTGSYSPTSLLEVFDPSTNSWSSPITTGSFSGRTGGTSCEVNGKIYVIGGEDEFALYTSIISIFDPSANTWDTLSTTGTFTPRGVLTSCFYGGKIYTFGGFNFDGALNIIEVLDPLTNVWSTPTTIGHFTPRGWLTSCVVNAEPNTRIYVIGGDNNSQYLNTNEYFTPDLSDVKNSSQSNPNISPNPTTGIITVRNAPANIMHVTITNVLGETVSEVANSGAEDFTIDLSKLLPGTYFAKFSWVGEVITRKIIKE
jgi:N-acetylneuraminic acid mutarotase